MTTQQLDQKANIEQFLRAIIEPSKGRVVAVLEKFGIYEAATPEVIIKAYRKYGQEFLRHFYDVYISSYEVSLTSMDGDDTGGVAESKEGKGFDFNELDNIMESAAKLWGTIFGGGGSSAPAQAPPPPPAPGPTIPMTNLKLSNPLVIVGGLLVTLVLILVVVKMIKK